MLPVVLLRPMLLVRSEDGAWVMVEIPEAWSPNDILEWLMTGTVT